MLSEYGTILLALAINIILVFIMYKLGIYFNNLIYKKSNYLENLIQIKEFLKKVGINDYINWVEKKQLKTVPRSVCFEEFVILKFLVTVN